MRNKLFAGVMLAILLVGMLTLTFSIQPAKASGTIYIRADGSVEGTTDISKVDNVTYTFTNNIYDSIIVERDDIVVDGAGYTVQGTGSGDGIGLSNRNNVTLKNVEVTNFNFGIRLISSSNNVLTGNTVSNNNYFGIHFIFSNNNTLSGNTVSSNNYFGIYLLRSSNNTLTGNTVSNNLYNFGVEGDGLSDFINHIDTSNTVDNMPIYYLIDEANVVIDAPTNAGTIYLINCNNITLKDLTLREDYVGALFFNTTNSKIENVTTPSNENGIYLLRSSNNTLTGNTVSKNKHGIQLISSSNNTVVSNTVSNNFKYGVFLEYSSNNVLSGNTASNHCRSAVAQPGSYNWYVYGIFLQYSGNNTLLHNNLINNTFQASVTTGYVNTWDNGYPSGGNYWSDYTGVDEKSGPNQDQPGSDGIGDTSYHVYGINQDNYPLMNPWPPPEHELVASITALTSIRIGSSSSLNATVTNQGSSDEPNVELLLLINGTTVDSSTIPLLQAGSSYTLSYPWTPTVEGTYNVTAYAHPVPGEASIENNQDTKFVTVAVSAPEVQVGVKAGDWIKCDYTVAGWPSGTPRPEWLKVEILSVEGTTATVKVTLHMSDGPEQSDTVNVDVATGNGTFQGLSGFVIPANSNTGDTIYMSGYGNITLDGETTKTCAGTSRTVVYASFSQFGTQLTYYWDKETGVMVEASTTSGGMTGTAKATETNMWKAAPEEEVPLWMQWWFYAIVAVGIVALVGVVYFLKKRKQPTASSLSTERGEPLK